MTAYDAFGNVKTNYPEADDSATMSGLSNSPAPTTHHPDYPTLTFANGVASGSVTAYLANDPLTPGDTSQLTVTDNGTGEGQSRTGTSNAFKVGPADIGSFTWTAPPDGTQTAGHVFTPSPISVTAYDTYSNVKFDENTNEFSGLGGPSPQGCSGHCDPVYGFSWSNGVASSTTAEAFVTGTGEHLTVTAGSVSQPSSAFDVGPDSLDHFEIGSIDNSHVAGTGFPVNVTAYDKFENVKTNYPETDDSPALGGLDPSPSGCNGAGHPTPNGTSPCPASYGGISWGSGPTAGQGTATVTGYKANDPLTGSDTSQLTVTDNGTGEGSGVSSDSNTFKLGPASLGSFTWTSQPDATQTAGHVFTPSTIAVTAYDIYGNVRYNQNSGSFSGLGASSPQGCRGPCGPVYGFSWSDGVAASTTVEAFVTGQNEHLTVTDGVFKQSSAFTVGPDSLDHFEFASINNSHIAGDLIPITVTAYDKFENIKTNYPETGDAAQFSGLLNSPAPVNHPPTYGPITWGSGTGIGTASIAAFRANDPTIPTDLSQLTLTGTGGEGAGKSGSSNTFTIGPAAIGSFTWTTQPGAAQTAGVVFTPATIRVTAFDIYSNVRFNESSLNATFSGLGNSSKGCLSDHQTVSAGASNFCQPVYGFTWTNGVASSTIVKDYKAQTTMLNVLHGSVSQNSSSVTVSPNTPSRLSFASADGGVQPTDTACKVVSVCPATNPPTNVINAAVYDEDAFGNPEIGVNVKLSIGTNAGSPAGTLTGTTIKPTGANGVATFGTPENLQIDNLGVGYTLKAESPSTGPTASVLSAGFNIANAVKSCNGNCQVSAVDQKDNITAAATGLNGKLSITMENKSIIGQCPGVTGNQAGNIDTINPTNPTSSPTLEVTGTLVRQNNTGGVGNFIFCKNMGGNTPFHPVQMCKNTKNVPPCLKSLTGAGQGSISFDLLVKATKNLDANGNWDGTWTFDPKMGGGT